MLLNIGDKAPGFTLNDHDGNSVSLSTFSGKKIILYFYPKDDTPGCTAEACSLRDNYSALNEKGCIIIGISIDDIVSHKKFSQKYSLPFLLLSDASKDVCKAYGVWGKKKFMGREYEGILRTTFIISENGFIESIISKVDTKNHALQIVKELEIIK
ncbi:MAG: thioredoxin-dependent thiol peroxidase [Lentimicrobiaceae bacterium]|nr:thioredoxin-dependent thiol peroxidase [Lentimicrobiaceae bacterium]